MLASEIFSISFIIISVILSTIVLCTIIGNVFVIIAILIDKNLQTTANQLVLSLAVADLMVACLVMPLGAYNDLYQGWYLGRGVCEFWTSADVLCCTASILNLLAIAMDRYWAVTSVDYIYRRTKGRVNMMILIAWTVSAVVSLAPIFGWKDPDFAHRVLIEHKCLVSQDVGYQIFATISTFYAPLVLLLGLYWRIFKVARKRIRTKPGRNELTTGSTTNNNNNNNNGTLALTLPPAGAGAVRGANCIASTRQEFTANNKDTKSTDASGYRQLLTNKYKQNNANNNLLTRNSNKGGKQNSESSKGDIATIALPVVGGGIKINESNNMIQKQQQQQQLQTNDVGEDNKKDLANYDLNDSCLHGVGGGAAKGQSGRDNDKLRGGCKQTQVLEKSLPIAQLKCQKNYFASVSEGAAHEMIRHQKLWPPHSLNNDAAATDQAASEGDYGDHNHRSPTDIKTASSNIRGASLAATNSGNFLNPINNIEQHPANKGSEQSCSQKRKRPSNQLLFAGLEEAPDKTICIEAACCGHTKQRQQQCTQATAKTTSGAAQCENNNNKHHHHHCPLDKETREGNRQLNAEECASERMEREGEELQKATERDGHSCSNNHLCRANDHSFHKDHNDYENSSGAGAGKKNRLLSPSELPATRETCAAVSGNKSQPAGRPRNFFFLSKKTEEKQQATAFNNCTPGGGSAAAALAAAASPPNVRGLSSSTLLKRNENDIRDSGTAKKKMNMIEWIQVSHNDDDDDGGGDDSNRVMGTENTFKKEKGKYFASLADDYCFADQKPEEMNDKNGQKENHNNKQESCSKRIVVAGGGKGEEKGKGKEILLRPQELAARVPDSQGHVVGAKNNQQLVTASNDDNNNANAQVETTRRRRKSSLNLLKETITNKLQSTLQLSKVYATNEFNNYDDNHDKMTNDYGETRRSPKGIIIVRGHLGDNDLSPIKGSRCSCYASQSKDYQDCLTETENKNRRQEARKQQTGKDFYFDTKQTSRGTPAANVVTKNVVKKTNCDLLKKEQQQQLGECCCCCETCVQIYSDTSCSHCLNTLLYNNLSQVNNGASSGKNVLHRDATLSSKTKLEQQTSDGDDDGDGNNLEDDFDQINHHGDKSFTSRENKAELFSNKKQKLGTDKTGKDSVSEKNCQPQEEAANKSLRDGQERSHLLDGRVGSRGKTKSKSDSGARSIQRPVNHLSELSVFPSNEQHHSSDRQEAECFVSANNSELTKADSKLDWQVSLCSNTSGNSPTASSRSYCSSSSPSRSPSSSPSSRQTFSPQNFNHRTTGQQQPQQLHLLLRHREKGGQEMIQFSSSSLHPCAGPCLITNFDPQASSSSSRRDANDNKVVVDPPSSGGINVDKGSLPLVSRDDEDDDDDYSSPKEGEYEDEDDDASSLSASFPPPLSEALTKKQRSKVARVDLGRKSAEITTGKLQEETERNINNTCTTTTSSTTTAAQTQQLDNILAAERRNELKELKQQQHIGAATTAAAPTKTERIKEIKQVERVELGPELAKRQKHNEIHSSKTATITTSAAAAATRNNHSTILDELLLNSTSTVNGGGGSSEKRGGNNVLITTGSNKSTENTLLPAEAAFLPPNQLFADESGFKLASAERVQEREPHCKLSTCSAWRCPAAPAAGAGAPGTAQCKRQNLLHHRYYSGKSAQLQARNRDLDLDGGEKAAEEGEEESNCSALKSKETLACACQIRSSSNNRNTNTVAVLPLPANCSNSEQANAKSEDVYQRSSRQHFHNQTAAAAANNNTTTSSKLDQLAAAAAANTSSMSMTTSITKAPPSAILPPQQQQQQQPQQSALQRTATKTVRSLDIKRKFRALGQLVSFVQTSRGFNSTSSSGPNSLEEEEADGDGDGSDDDDEDASSDYSSENDDHQEEEEEDGDGDGDEHSCEAEQEPEKNQIRGDNLFKKKTKRAEEEEQNENENERKRLQERKAKELDCEKGKLIRFIRSASGDAGRKRTPLARLDGGRRLSGRVSSPITPFSTNNNNNNSNVNNKISLQTKEGGRADIGFDVVVVGGARAAGNNLGGDISTVEKLSKNIMFTTNKTPAAFTKQELLAGSGPKIEAEKDYYHLGGKFSCDTVDHKNQNNKENSIRVKQSNNMSSKSEKLEEPKEAEAERLALVIHQHQHQHQQQQHRQSRSNSTNKSLTSMNINNQSMRGRGSGSRRTSERNNNASTTPGSRRQRKDMEIRREKKAAKTLAIITGVFVCCWLPFFLNAIIMPICGPSCTPSDLILSILLWLGYLNSLLNPLIYTIFSPDFRRAFRRLLCWPELTTLK